MDLNKVKTALKQNKKNLIYIIVAVIIWLVVSYSMFLTSREEWYVAARAPKTIESFEDSSGIDEGTISVTDSLNVTQNIKIAAKEISGLSLKFEAKSQPEKGDILVSLFEKDSGNLLTNWEMPAKNIPVNNICYLLAEETLTLKENGEYTIELTASGIEEGSLNLVMAKSPEDGRIETLVNGDPSDYAMEYRITFGNHSAIRYLLLAFYLGMTVAIFAVAILFIKGVRLECIFLVFTLVIGMLYLFALPPYTVPDEASHFVTAYSKTSSILGKTATDDNGLIVIEDERLWGASKSYPTRDSYDTYIRGALGMTEPMANEEISPRAPLNIMFTGYFPQMIGITLGRLLHFNPEQILLIGRFFSLIWYLIVMFFAIKLMPFGKMGLFAIGTLPMTMQMVVSYNYDSILLGACFFAFAYLLYLIYKKEQVKNWDIVLLSVIGIVIASIKFIYLPILGLALFIPKEKFKSKHGKIIAGAIIVVLSVAVLLYSKISFINRIANPHTSSTTGTGEAITVGYFLRHPRSMFNIFFRTFEHKTSFYIFSMLASPLGWVEINLPEIIVFAFLLVLMLSLITKGGEKTEVSAKIKVFSTVAAALMAFLGLVAMLFDVTVVGSGQIEGFQGRYLLPILVLAIIALRNRVIVSKTDLKPYLGLSLSLLHCYSIFFIALTVIGR